MYGIDISNIGLFKRKETIKSPGGNTWDGLVFMVSGLLKRVQSGIDTFTSKPHFIFSRANVPHETILGHGRENWVIIFKNNILSKSDIKGFVNIATKNATLLLPEIAFVPPEKVSLWRLELQKMQDCLREPTTYNLQRAELGLYSVFKFISDSTENTEASSPAERLKRYIDNDESFSESLSSLSRRCGYSVDHLRILFTDKYKMAPKQYRNNRRFAFAMELICNSQLSVKEISVKIGFEFVPAFSSMFKKHSGITPRKAIEKYRTV